MNTFNAGQYQCRVESFSFVSSNKQQEEPLPRQIQSKNIESMNKALALPLTELSEVCREVHRSLYVLFWTLQVTTKNSKRFRSHGAGSAYTFGVDSRLLFVFALLYI